ncbi:methionine--tRNA ligase [Anaerocaecibacter muris]|uniref:methionine--tRNA ligase n=1 Tax=Anaerocaecibacter muris TaxID=2941513 RepID=UPI003F68F759
MAKSKPTFYITTPIYYASGALHIGHCYTTVACDAIARFKRMDGYDVYYLTGTDEHGQKVQKAAEERGLSPQAFVDGLAERIQKLWERMDISNDGFIRTTDKAHEKAIADIFTKLYEKGDIYKSEYSGKYCEPCESFWTASQLVNGKCPDCGREVRDSKEECYFFRLSKYADRVRKLLTETDFLQPDSRVKEMVNNFIDKGLNDLAVTRTSFDWGIKVPFDEKHVIYVWIDALPNYITALGYGAGDDAKYKKYWPCDMHVMAKEIVRFHSIVWPAILMALEIPLPKRLYGHGWIMFGGDKMSKSKGNVVDPFVLTDRYGVDALRYYLLSSMPFGDDSNYTSELLLSSINVNLVNDLGNLVRRTFAMSKQYFGGAVKKPAADDRDAAYIKAIDALAAAVRADMDKPEINRALEKIFGVIDLSNKYIDENKPWELKKTGDDIRLNAVMYNLLDGIRVCANMLLPFLTKYPRRIFDGLGLPVPTDFAQAKHGVIEGYSTTEIEPILNRLDIKKELAELEKIAEQAEVKPTAENSGADSAQNTQAAEEPQLISIDDFFKSELVVAEVEACEKVEKAKKLLKLTVFDGTRRRTVVSGIALAYKPEEVTGKKVALVANLKPAKLCGIVSEGMLLCSVGEDGLPRLVHPDGKAGDKIC